MELTKDQIFMLEVGKGFLLTGDAVVAETPLGHYILDEKPNWLTGDYKSHVFINEDKQPLDPSHTVVNWVLAMRNNNQIDLVAKADNYQYQIFLSGNQISDLELPIKMIDATSKNYEEVSVNFVDRFYTSEIFLGSDNPNFQKQIQYKPTGVQIKTNLNDYSFIEYPDRRSISIEAQNSSPQKTFALIIGSGDKDNEFIDLSNLETSIPNNDFLNEQFTESSVFSVFELELKGKAIYGEEFSLQYEKNIYVGAIDENNKCCVGGVILSEQRASMEVPAKGGSSRLSLATPTPTPTITPSITSTPPVTTTPSVSLTTTPSISATTSKTPTPSASFGASPSPTPSVSVTPSLTATPSNTPQPTPTPSLSVGAEIPMPESIVIEMSPASGAPNEFVGNYLLNNDKVSYVSLDGKFALRWINESYKWKLQNLETGKIIGFSKTGNKYDSLINNIITCLDGQSRKFFYAVNELKVKVPVPAKNINISLGGPLSLGKSEKIKITSIDGQNVKIYMWRDEGFGTNVNDFEFYFPSTKKYFGFFTLRDPAFLFDTRYYRQNLIRNVDRSRRFLYLPTYPSEHFIDDGIGNEYSLSIDRYIRKPAGSYTAHQWETSSVDPIFSSSSATNKAIKLKKSDTLSITNNSSQTFEIRDRATVTKIILSVAPGQTKSIQIKSNAYYKCGDFTIRDSADNFNNKWGQFNMEWSVPKYRGENGLYERDTIVYEADASTTYMGYTPPSFTPSWERNIYGTYTYSKQIAVFRSAGIEDGVEYNYLEFFIGGANRHPVKIKDLVNFINTDQRLTDLISAEYFDEGMNPLSYRPDNLMVQNPESTIVPFDFFKERQTFNLTNIQDIDLDVIDPDEDIDFGEEEELFTPVEIPENNEQKKFFDITQVDIVLELNEVALDIGYKINDVPSHGMALKFSILEDGKGKINATEEQVVLTSSSPAKGNFKKSLKNLFDFLPIRDSQKYNSRNAKSNKLFLLTEFTFLNSTVQLVKSDEISSQLIDRIEKKDNYYKQESWLEAQASYDILAQPNNEFSYEIESLRDFTGNNVDIDYSRLKITLPYSWRMVKNATLRIRVMPTVETKSGTYLDLNFIDGKIFNKNELGRNNIPIEGQSNPDSYYWANSSNNYPGKRQEITTDYLNPYADNATVSNATYFGDLIQLNILNHNDIVKSPKSTAEIPEGQALFLEADKVLEIVMPVSQDSESDFVIDENGEPVIYTPWLNSMKPGNNYFSISLLCGKNYENFTNFEGELEGDYIQSMEKVNVELDLKYKNYMKAASIGFDLASFQEYAHFIDIDRNNNEYQVFAWSDGYWSKQKTVIYEGDDTEDGPGLVYGTAEFEANERYTLESLEGLPFEPNTYENDPNVIGSALGKYYKYKGEPVRRGNVYYASKGEDNTAILKHLKDPRVAQIVYDAYFQQKTLLKNLKTDYDLLWNGTHKIYQQFRNSSVMSDIASWMLRPDANLNGNSMDEKHFPYAGAQDYNNANSVVRRMLTYLACTYYNTLDYSVYKDPRQADSFKYELESFTFARTRDEEFSKIMALEMSSMRGGYQGTSGPDAIVNPFQDLDPDPQIFVGENGCIIYREPVFASIPYINLFTSPLANDLNAYRGSQSFQIPYLQFPVHGGRSYMGDDKEGVVFGKVHEDIFNNLNPFKEIYGSSSSTYGTQDPSNLMNYNYDALTDPYGYGTARYYEDEGGGYQIPGMDMSADSSQSYDQGGSYYDDSYNTFDSSQYGSDPYSNYSNSYLPNDTYGQMNPSYGSENYYDAEASFQHTPGSNDQRESINVLKRLSNELKLPVNVLYGIKWTMVYPGANKGDAYLFKEHFTKVREGYTNDFRPNPYYDTLESLEYKFRNGNLYGQTLGLKSNDPFYHFAQGNEFVKVYGSLLESEGFAIEPDQYKKIFWSDSEWTTKLRNDNSDSNNPNYQRAGRYIDLVNYFHGKVKYTINNFPFKDFGMEAF